MIRTYKVHQAKPCPQWDEPVSMMVLRGSRFLSPVLLFPKGSESVVTKHGMSLA